MRGFPIAVVDQITLVLYAFDHLKEIFPKFHSSGLYWIENVAGKSTCTYIVSLFVCLNYHLISII